MHFSTILLLVHLPVTVLGSYSRSPPSSLYYFYHQFPHQDCRSLIFLVTPIPPHKVILVYLLVLPTILHYWLHSILFSHFFCWLFVPPAVSQLHFFCASPPSSNLRKTLFRPFQRRKFLFRHLF